MCLVAAGALGIKPQHPRTPCKDAVMDTRHWKKLCGVQSLVYAELPNVGWHTNHAQALDEPIALPQCVGHYCQVHLPALSALPTIYNLHLRTV
jgi:hypothetical protein